MVLSVTAVVTRAELAAFPLLGVKRNVDRAVGLPGREYAVAGIPG